MSEARGLSLADRLAALSPRQRQLLEAQLRARERGGGASIPRSTAGAGPFPLSFAQLRLWMLARLQPESAIHVSSFRRLWKRPRPEALEGALRELVERHEVLRTAFLEIEGEPVQTVRPTGRVRLPVVDLRGLDLFVAEDRLRRLAQGNAGRPFDLERPPLLHAVLVRLAERDFGLLLSMPHLVADDWSIALFFRELPALEEACAAGRPSPLPELPIRYADFVVWQREHLAGETLDRHLAYWRRRLDGIPPALELPLDRPRPPIQTYDGAAQTILLSADLSDRWRGWVRALGSTPFVTLLAVFAAFLTRISGETDVVVGSPAANRTRQEVEGLIGLFVDTFVLRADLSGRPTWRGLAAALGRQVLEAQTHQDLPFQKLLEALAPVRSLARSPLFQVMFVTQRGGSESEWLSGERTLFGEPRAVPQQYDLTLRADDGGSYLTLSLEYNVDLFDPTTIGRWARQLVRLLEAVLADPDRPLAEIGLLGPAAAQQVLVEWNDAPAPAAPVVPDSVPAAVRRRARERPEAVAVVGGDHHLSYAELAGRAGALAGRLVELGAGPGIRVAVALDRSEARGADLPAVLVGVLAAGAAYVPLDPSYPPDRLAFMLADSKAALLVGSKAARGVLPGSAAPAVELILDAPQGAPWEGPGSSDLPPGELRPEEPAYVIYTSGSTGRPKGVEVPHGALANFLSAMAAVPGLGSGTRLAAVTPLSFDIAGLELLGPLVAGGTVVVVSAEASGDGGLLAGRLAASRATHAQATPATWRMLLAAGWTGEPGLAALCGGEALPGALAVELRGRVGELWNLYGPTETTVWSSVQRVGPLGPAGERSGAREPVAIGRPIARTRLTVADRGLRPCPPGVAGELVIGGAGVARGYVGRPAATAERFVPDPFPAVGEARGSEGGRIYRTGDRVRQRPDGRLEFLGRLDFQVKVRGFRIEPGEIEASLAEHPGVSEAVVAVTGEGEEARLAAWVVAVEEAGRPTSEALRAHLRRALPEHFVPGVWVFLDALPLTPNNKVDRKRLPAPEAGGDDGIYEPPRTELEGILAGLWAEVLKVARVGRGDHFFRLGGHSLLGTRLIFRIQRELGLNLPMRSLFDAPTLAEQARVLAELRGAAGGAPDPVTLLGRLRPDPEHADEPFPLTDIQQAYWVGRTGAFELGEVATHVYFDVEDRNLDVDRFEAAWQAMVERHGMLRAVVDPDGRQRMLPRVPPYRIHRLDLRGLPEAAQQAGLEAVREEMSHQVLPADRWPLFDLRVTILDGGRQYLHVSLDLLIGDAWSFEILQRELFRLYSEPGTELAPLGISFRDYVLAELRLRDTGLYAASRAYWLDRLDSLPPAPELPLAREPGALARPRFARRSLRLAPARWRRLQARGREHGLSPSGLLVAAFAEVLRVWSKSPRFTINLTLFNRLPIHPQVDELVGDFTSLTLLAVEPPGSDGFAAAARSVQARLWEDLDHRWMSGVAVLRELARRRRGPWTLMPVIFTSTLNVADDGVAEVSGEPGEPEAPAGGDDAAPSEEGSGFSITQTPQVWLDCQVVETAGALVSNWDAVEDLFPEGLLDAMFAAFGDLVRRLADDEDAWHHRPLGLVPAEQLAVRAASNDTARALPVGLLHAPFRARAAERPEATAVLAARDDGTFLAVTYRELRRAALRLGARLRELGARPGRLVAVVMEKGWEQAAAVLGVLEAGGAYLPLDPALPEERLAHLLAHGEVETALTQPRFADRLPWPEDVRVLPVEEALLAPPEAGPEPAAPPAVASPTDLAYVIFTSGSTGLPKGVMIDHRGAANTCLDINERFRVGPGDRVLGLSSLSFDLSVWDVFGLLGAGGTLVLPEPAATRDPGRWAALAADAQVTVWNTVPALLELLVEYLESPPPGSPPGSGGGGPVLPLRLAMLSGDWIPVSLPDRARAVLPGLELVSLGGATEASIWSIAHPIGEVDPSWSSIPYGRALANQSFHVLDGDLETRPDWAVGELYIGGAGVALGYWRDEARTAAAFLRHPATGERLYRTGDLGRALPGGTLEFLGREDQQVKVQGFRVELGEIEAALERHPLVRSAVAAAVGPARGERRLAAYLVAEGGDLDEEAARRFLAERLPAYMVPSIYVFLGALPLTANGKVDRRALPAPGDAEAEGSGDEAASAASPKAAPPPSPHLDAIASAVAEVLGREAIDPSADLLDLGATSIDVIRIANRLESRLGFRPRIDDFYRVPSLRGLAALHAAWLEEESRRPAAEEAPAPEGLAAILARFPLLRDPAERDAFKAERRGLPGEDRGRLRIGLPEPGLGGGAAPALLARRSRRHFATEPFPALRLGRLLEACRQVEEGDAARRLYPSAGALYPVQVYLYVEEGRVDGLEGGTYYYDPEGHRLITLVRGARLDPSIHEPLVNRPIFRRSAFSLFLVAQLDAIGPLYGEAALGFSLLEAGYLGQQLMVRAESRGLGLCPVGGVDEGALRELLVLGPGHRLLHSFLGGAVPESGDGEAAPVSFPAPAGTPAPTPAREVDPAPRPAPSPSPLLRSEERREGPQPLFYPQRRLWFLHRLAPKSPAYNIHRGVPLHGPVDMAAMRAALSALVRRHEALRSRFGLAGGEPVVRVVEARPEPLPVVDLRGLPPSARRRLAADLGRAESRRPFDLDGGRVWRAWALRAAEAEHVIHVSVHHIVADAWSVGILSEDLGRLYATATAGEAAGLPELPVQYLDFVLWQRRALAGPALGEQLEYWREQLAGAPQVLELPTDRPRPEVLSDAGMELTSLLPRSLVEALDAVRRGRGSTLFMALLAGFGALLRRLGAGTELVLGVPVAGRSHAEVEDVVGLFINTLVLRLDLSGRPSFETLLARVRETAVAAFARPDVPFEMLIEELRPERSLGRSPLVQALFQLHGEQAARRDREVPESVAVRPALHAVPSKLDHEVALSPHPAGLVLRWIFRSDLYDSTTLLRWQRSWRRLLAGMAAEPGRPVEELGLLAPAETQQVLVEWSEAPDPKPFLHVPAAVRARAAERPEATAVVSAAGHLSYGELARRAAAVARRLRELGAGLGGRVGVALERSGAGGADLPVALLGVMASGAAYVPLDPAYPAERLAFMVEDSGAALRIVHRGARGVLPAAEWCGGEAGELILDDPAGTPWSRSPGEGPGIPASALVEALWPAAPAYVIYTSGSTGRPKGVEVPHGALANFLAAMARRPGLGPDTRLAAVTPLSFDIAGLELLGPLAVGGTVVAVSAEEAGDGRLLARRLAASRATHAQATPATWRMLLAAGWSGEPALAALCGGEALPEALAGELAGRVRELWNLYGPTETTVWSAVERVAAGSPVEGGGGPGPVAIGRPIARTRLTVVDDELRPRPAGVAGELVIGGAGVARGYLGRPGLTAERFVPDPFPAVAGVSGVAGGRLYRTGDRVRQRADGRLEFLGRIDFQVKVRGFRVEPGEIEAALASHPEVAEAVVGVLGEGGTAALAAWVVGRDGGEIRAEELRGHLRRSLPEHMVPGVWMGMERLPLTPNGKVDRRALPEPGDAEGRGESRRVEPRTLLEASLASLFAEILQRDAVGVEDDFFRLGGHSLLGNRLIFRIQESFGAALPMRALFEAPTPAGLARRVEESRGGIGSTAAPATEPDEDREEGEI